MPPELVVRDKNGVIHTVNYSLLPAMLLNEVQRQKKTIDALEKRLAALEAKLP